MAKQLINTLSIIIPTINESSRLPLLLADLKSWPEKFDINIVDGGSSDLTVLISKLSGANIINSCELNRGLQMQLGAQYAKGNWLLFLHADCRLDPNWSKKIHSLIQISSSKKYCFYFDFKLKGGGFRFWFLEKAVAFRSLFLQRPYGDQGLLIHKSLYEKAGGISPFCIMEDIDFITKVTKITTVKSLELPLYTDPRKWKGISIIKQAVINFNLRRRWRKGESLNKIYKQYYS